MPDLTNTTRPPGTEAGKIRLPNLVHPSAKAGPNTAGKNFTRKETLAGRKRLMDRKNRWKETLVGMVRLTDRKDRWNGTLAEKNIPWNGTEKSMDKKING